MLLCSRDPVTPRDLPRGLKHVGETRGPFVFITKVKHVEAITKQRIRWCYSAKVKNTWQKARDPVTPCDLRRGLKHVGETRGPDVLTTKVKHVEAPLELCHAAWTPM